MGARITQPQAQLDQTFMEEIEKKITALLQQAKQLSGGGEEEGPIAKEIRRKLEAILYLPIITSRYPQFRPKGVKAVAEYLHNKLNDSPYLWGTLFSWLSVHVLGKMVDHIDFAGRSHAWIDEWGLGKTITDVLKELTLDEAPAWRVVTLVKLLTTHQRWFEMKPSDQKQAY